MKKPKKKKVTIEDLEKLLQEIKAERAGRCPCCGREYKPVPSWTGYYPNWEAYYDAITPPSTITLTVP